MSDVVGVRRGDDGRLLEVFVADGWNTLNEPVADVINELLQRLRMLEQQAAPTEDHEAK